MARLRVHGFSISIDGYGAGPHQGLEHPLGVGGHALHEWVVLRLGDSVPGPTR